MAVDREKAPGAGDSASDPAAGDMPATTNAEPLALEPPDVLAPRGAVVLKLADWTMDAFQCDLGEGEDAVTVVVTRQGIRVTKAQAEQIQAAARAHGVELNEETPA